MAPRLNVNIDHVATVREARKTIEPDVVEAAAICERAGAHGITIHLRSDRRHIQDSDVRTLKASVTTYLNVEMAATDEMIGIALEIRPDAVSLVPESPHEVTTEGGLNVAGNLEELTRVVGSLKNAGILVSIFIDPEISQIEAASAVGAQQIEICTAEFAELTLGRKAGELEGSREIVDEIERIRKAAVHARSKGLAVAAGHGLTIHNIRPLIGISEIAEYNIGHHIISKSIFIGLESAVKNMVDIISGRH